MVYNASFVTVYPLANDGSILAGEPVALKTDGTITKYTSTNKRFVGIAIDNAYTNEADVQGVQKTKASFVFGGQVTAKVKTEITQVGLVSIEEGGIKPASAEADAIGVALEVGKAGEFVTIILNSITPTIA